MNFNSINTICDLLDSFKMKESFPAIISHQQTISYKDISEGSQFISSILLKKVNPHSNFRIGVYVSQKLALCYSFYGITRCGFSAMLFPENMPPAQFKYLIEQYCPDGLIVDEKKWTVLKNQIINYKKPIFLLKASEVVELHCLSSSPSHNIQFKKSSVSPASEATVLFTSGTSGKKKAVPITHRNLVETTKMINRFMSLNSPITELVTVPLTHAFGLRRIFCNHIVGGTVVVDDGALNPARALKILRDLSCTGISSVPSVFRILKANFKDVLKQLGPQIKFIELGSASLSKLEKEQLCDIFPNAQICMHYGLTEASKATFIHFFREKDKLSTVGKPSPGVSIKIMSEKEREVKNGKAGEIWVNGFNVAKSYLMNTELTQEKFKDGWFRSGDIGRFDKDGYLILLGRKDDMINVGGNNMYPPELEDYIRDHYFDLDIAIAGMPHKFLGNIPVLCHAKHTPIDNKLFLEIINRLKEEFEEYKIPKYKFKFQKIPKTKNGKIIRKELNQLLKEMEPTSYENK